MDEAQMLGRALRASGRRIGVFLFLFLVVLAQVVLGYLMVVFESSHPRTQLQTVGQGLYRAIVTMTTVGYGDFVLQTVQGQLLVALVMLRFGIIAIPTGIFTVETIHQSRQDRFCVCRECGNTEHRCAASHCDQCGAVLP